MNSDVSHCWRGERKQIVNRGMLQMTLVGFNVGSDERGTDSRQRYAPGSRRLSVDSLLACRTGRLSRTFFAVAREKQKVN